MELKAKIYDCLSGVNKAADKFTVHLRTLAELAVVTPEFAELRRLTVEVTRREINHSATLTLVEIEQGHASQTEKALSELQAKLQATNKLGGSRLKLAVTFIRQPGIKLLGCLALA